MKKLICQVLISTFFIYISILFVSHTLASADEKPEPRDCYLLADQPRTTSNNEAMGRGGRLGCSNSVDWVWTGLEHNFLVTWIVDADHKWGTITNDTWDSVSKLDGKKTYRTRTTSATGAEAKSSEISLG